MQGKRRDLHLDKSFTQFLCCNCCCWTYQKTQFPGVCKWFKIIIEKPNILSVQLLFYLEIDQSEIDQILPWALTVYNYMYNQSLKTGPNWKEENAEFNSLITLYCEFVYFSLNEPVKHTLSPSNGWTNLFIWSLNRRKKISSKI